MARSSLRAGPWIDRLHDELRSWTAPLGQVAHLVPPGGTVLELGCGQGLLVQRLALQASHVIGVDFDPRKCRMARARLHDCANVTIVESELEEYLRHTARDAADTIVLSDTLSSLPHAMQDRVLSQAIRCLRPGGLLLLAIVDTTPRWKAVCARTLSFIIYRMVRASLAHGTSLYHRAHNIYVSTLRAASMRVDVIALHRLHHRVIPHIAILGWKDVGPT